MRVAYLCGPMHLLSALARITPPWAVGLPAQVAAVRALAEEPYYAARYRETHCLRAELVAGLRRIGIEEIVPGTANFVLCHLDADQPTAADVVNESRKYGVFLRDASLMGTELGPRALRIAVKDRATNAIVVETLERVFDAASLATAVPLMQISA
jgi:histidinol-phosphate/aromatic aminotransferase/cobyric acid decarboxylase-like protein